MTGRNKDKEQTTWRNNIGDRSQEGIKTGNKDREYTTWRNKTGDRPQEEIKTGNKDREYTTGRKKTMRFQRPCLYEPFRQNSTIRKSQDKTVWSSQNRNIKLLLYAPLVEQRRS